jgi:hypothetical protein
MKLSHALCAVWDCGLSKHCERALLPRKEASISAGDGSLVEKVLKEAQYRPPHK